MSGSPNDFETHSNHVVYEQEGTSSRNQKLAEAEKDFLKEKEAAEMAVKNITLAVTKMKECVNSLPVQNLNDAVGSFRKAYSEFPAWQSLRYDAYSGLAYALGVRFIYIGQFDDYIEFVGLIQSQMDNIKAYPDDKSNAIPILDELGTTTKEAYESAHKSLDAFHKHLPGTVLEEIINLLKPAIEVLQIYGSEAYDILALALLTLAKAQYAAFHLADVTTSSLANATSSLTDIIKIRPTRDVPFSLDYTIDAYYFIMMHEQAEINLDEEIANLQNEGETGNADTKEEVLSTQVEERSETQTAPEEKKVSLTSPTTTNISKSVKSADPFDSLPEDQILQPEELEDETITELILFASSLLAACKLELPLQVLQSNIEMLRRALCDASDTHPVRPELLKDLGFALALDYMHSGDTKSCMASIGLLCSGKIYETNDSSKATGGSPLSEGSIYAIKSAAKASLDTIHNAVSLSALNTVVFVLSWVIVGTSDQHPLYMMTLLHLSDALFLRFHVARQRDDLESAIRFVKHAGTYDAAQNTFYIRHHLFFRSFVLMMTHADLSGDTDEFREVLEHVGDIELELKKPSVPTSDPNSFLAETGYNHDIHSNNAELVSKEIQHSRNVLAKSIVGTAFYCSSASTLASLLSFQFEEQYRRADMDEAMSWAELALNLTPESSPERPARLKTLARLLSDRFSEGNVLNDLETALLLMRKSLKITPPDHPRRWEYLVELGQVLLEHFEQHGDLTTLEEVIRLQVQARKLVSKDDPGEHVLLNTLGLALARRYECVTGLERDLDEATEVLRAAMALTPRGHRGRLQSLCNLGGALYLRFELTGQRSFLEKAIALRQEALKLVIHPGNSSHLSLVENLSMLLSTRYRLTGERDDIDNAVSLARQALEMIPSSHSRRQQVSMRLATRLMMRANQLQEHRSRDINEAILYGKQAMQHTAGSQNHILQPLLLINLSSVLTVKWSIGLDRHALDEAILMAVKALLLIPSERPQHAICLYQLGTTFSQAYATINEKPYLEHAMNAFRKCLKSTSISPALRYEIVTEWSTVAEYYNHGSAIEAYDAAMDILPQMVSFNLDVYARQEVLSSNSVTGLARKAARCALKRGLYGKAVEYLEAGRAVFWGQVQRLRSPLDKLHHHHRKTAEKLHSLFAELEKGSYRNKVLDPLEVGQNLTFDKESSRLSRLNEELLSTLTEIRKLENFGSFLKPHTISEIQAAAKDGPVVFVIHNENESSCIILTAAELFHVSIPKFDTDTLSSFVSCLSSAQSGSWVKRSSLNFMESLDIVEEQDEHNDRLGAKRVRSSPDVSSDAVFREILTCLWLYVVEPVLKRLGIKKSDKRPLIRWCATGLFSFLPIHAAGRYLGDTPYDHASDYIVSSYTPTVEQLFPKEGKSNVTGNVNTLVVAHNGLFSVGKEVNLISSIIPSSGLKILGTPNSNKPARVEDVIADLPTTSIVHFACHGNQDVRSPLSSCLTLGQEVQRTGNGVQTVIHEILTIEEIMKHPLLHGALAVLLACESAMGDEKLPDEALSIGGALLFAGFDSVIATMWKMADADGPTIASTLYDVLFLDRDGKRLSQPDVRKSAIALDTAVQKLRSTGVEFRRWVPFIHLGN